MLLLHWLDDVTTLVLVDPDDVEVSTDVIEAAVDDEIVEDGAGIRVVLFKQLLHDLAQY